jgi:uncharacterized protein
VSKRILLDTGPLVAYLKQQDAFHNWAVTQLATIQPPLLTCEAVIVEACFLLRNTYGGQGAVTHLLNTKNVQIPFRLAEESEAVGELLTRYQSVPMSLTDACLVRMAELYADSTILTLDSDFTIYRKNKNLVIPAIMPTQR